MVSRCARMGIALILLICGSQWQLQAAEPAPEAAQQMSSAGKATGETTGNRNGKKSSQDTIVDQQLLSLSELGIAVAVIESIALEPLPQADSEPLPTAHLKIMESLRPGVPQTVRFAPLLYGSDAYQSMSRDQRMHWKGMDLSSARGKEWILITRGSSVIASYPFTTARVNYVKQHMAAGGFGGPLLLFLALMIVGLAVLNWLLSAALPPVGAFCILILQLACFGVYEYGVPPGSSNRMDLLFLIPAILFNLWLTFRRRPLAASQTGSDRPD